MHFAYSTEKLCTYKNMYIYTFGEQVVAFSSWVFNGEQNRSHYTAPELFDWEKITTYAPFDNLNSRDSWPENGTLYSNLFCKAHQYVGFLRLYSIPVIFGYSIHLLRNTRTTAGCYSGAHTISAQLPVGYQSREKFGDSLF